MPLGVDEVDRVGNRGDGRVAGVLRQLQLQHPLGEERLRGLKHGHEVLGGLGAVVHVEVIGVPEEHDDPLPLHDLPHALLPEEPADLPVYARYTLPVGEGVAGVHRVGEHVVGELLGGIPVGDAGDQRTVAVAATDARLLARAHHGVGGAGEEGVERVLNEDGVCAGLVDGLVGDLDSEKLAEGHGVGHGVGGGRRGSVDEVYRAVLL